MNITTCRTVEDIIGGESCPIPLEIFPNKMGINLVSVESLEWTEQDDGQLVNLLVNFTPNNKSESKS